MPFTMRVGETGEAYFVFETDEDVPEDMVASPMSEAVKDEQMDDPVRSLPRVCAVNSWAEKR